MAEPQGRKVFQSSSHDIFILLLSFAECFHSIICSLVTIIIFPSMRNYTVSFLAFLYVSLFFHFSASELRPHLERGATLSVEDDTDFISSLHNSFTCGFYQVGNNTYLFAIWFTYAIDKTVVWTANRDRPVNGRGSKIDFKRNGVMTLTDVDGTVVWQSSTNNSKVAARAKLLDSGNLVLTDTGDNILWQSFDYPTDTLLPSQRFTKSSRLVSSLRKSSFESGYHNLYYDSNNVLTMVYDGPEVSSIYWPNPDFNVYANGRTNYNNTRIAFLDDVGRFHSSDRLLVNAGDLGFGIQRRLTIDYDGNLRIYSLINSTGLWKISWQAIAQPCSIRGICGANGICVYERGPQCSCPPGYVVREPSDWNKGCKPNFSLKQLNSQQHVKFVAISHADYYGFDLSYTEGMTFDECRESCLKDFRCRAFSYRLTGKGQCYPKGILFNGYRTPDFPATIYIKVPTTVQTSELVILRGPNGSNVECGSRETEVQIGSAIYDAGGSNRRVKWVYLYSFCSAIGAIELVFFALSWCFLFRKNGVPATIDVGYQMIANQFRRFSYAELKKATNNFKEELGRGGSGAVYKGVLGDGRAVAVKRLGDVLQAEQEFWAETSTIGKINHMNLVRMWGYCSEGRNRLLVYEHIENSSLDRWLFSTNFLGWKQRFAVALGTAKGLAYLHHECLEWVIHCDVKPENILLDGDFEPKIADFGLAKLSQRGGTGSLVTRIRGTKGYMAPEWALNHPITAKVDVYSYGVVILEMARGSRLSNWGVGADDDCDDDGGHEEPELTKFVRKTKKKIEGGEEGWLEKIVDPRLDGKFSREQAAMVVEIGISCVEEDRSKRPTMATVAQTLLQLQCEN